MLELKPNLLLNMVPSISAALIDHTELQTYYREETVTWTTGLIWREQHWRTSQIPYMKVSDVAINAHNYCSDIAKIAAKDFELVFDIEKIKEEVKSAVLQAFDTTKTDFNPDVIIIPLDDVLSKLKLTPMALLDQAKYDELLTESVNKPCYETASGMAELTGIQFNVLRAVEEEAKTIMFSKNKEIEKLLNANAGTFIDKISDTAQNNMIKIQQQMQNKEESIKQHQDFQKKILQMKQALNAFL